MHDSAPPPKSGGRGPSSPISPEKRKQIGEHAVNVARSCNYLGGGHGGIYFRRTPGEYYFLEMNTRLQVEHPVTEMVTGVDLVREQILRCTRRSHFLSNKTTWQLNGHAIEVRDTQKTRRITFCPIRANWWNTSPPKAKAYGWTTDLSAAWRYRILRPHDRQTHRACRHPRCSHRQNAESHFGIPHRGHPNHLGFLPLLR